MFAIYAASPVTTASYANNAPWWNSTRSVPLQNPETVYKYTVNLWHGPAHSKHIRQRS